MHQSETLESHLTDLFVKFPYSVQDTVDSATAETWINNLTKARQNPATAAQAWLPILKTINQNYCFGKFIDYKSNGHVALFDPRHACSFVANVCISDLNSMTDPKDRQSFIEQIALLLVVKANLSHCYTSGHPMVYLAYFRAIEAAEEFINKHQLAWSAAGSALYHMKAAGDAKSYAIVSQELFWAKKSLEKERKQPPTNTDAQEANNEIQEKVDFIRCQERELSTYSYDYFKSLGTAYCIDAKQSLSKPAVLATLAAGLALAGYTVHKCRI